MQRITGVSDVEKVASSSGARQQLFVIEDGAKVILSLSANSFPAALTPEEARHVARCLRTAAMRVEANPT